MKVFINDFDNLQFKMKLSLFDSLVKSVLCYGCEIWGFCEAKNHEIFYLQFLKNTLNVRKTTPNCFIYKECNSIPLYLTRLLRMVKFWLKIISLNNMSPAKLLYNTALEMSINSESIVSSWIHEVKNILFRYGFGYVWLNQHLANDYPFFNAFKLRVTDVFLAKEQHQYYESKQEQTL